MAKGKTWLLFGLMVPIVPHQLLVQFDGPVGNLTGIEAVFQHHGVYDVQPQFDVERVLAESRNKYPRERWEALARNLLALRHRYLLSVDPDLLIPLKEVLDRSKSVLKTSYNEWLMPDRIPNDEAYHLQWGLSSIGAETAWELNTDAGNILVGVTDGGFDQDHEDLRIENEGDLRTGWPACDEHGTQVAGIIGAVGNNAVGISGVFWSGRLALYRKGRRGEGDSCPSSMAAAEAAIEAALRDGVDIINNSYGYSDWLLDDIEAIRETVLYVNSAGNGGEDQVGDDDDVDPVAVAFSRLPHTLQVANADETGARHESSDFGATTVHLAAPGTGILSTTPGNDYWFASGTSFAAPFVTGVAALAWSECPELSVAQIRQVLLDSVTVDRAHWEGLTVTEGIVNAPAALLEIKRICHTDSDGDGLTDPTDNCPEVANPDQEDLDCDGIGTACEAGETFDGCWVWHRRWRRDLVPPNSLITKKNWVFIRR